MENYKKKLKTRIVLFSALLITSIALMAITIFFRNGSSDFEDYLSGFQIGILTGLSCIFVERIYKHLRALKDERSLKTFYNSENDERVQKIKQKAGGNIFLCSIVATLFAAIVSGYYSKVIFNTLFACGVFQALLMSGSKTYYAHKY